MAAEPQRAKPALVFYFTCVLDRDDLIFLGLVDRAGCWDGEQSICKQQARRLSVHLVQRSGFNGGEHWLSHHCEGEQRGETRWCFETHNCFCPLQSSDMRIEPGFFVSVFPVPFSFCHPSGMMMDCEVAEEEQRESFIYPLVFIFCFEKWAELGGPVLGGLGHAG